MKTRSWMSMGAVALCLALTGCGSLLETTIPPPQAYVLRSPLAATATATASAAAPLPGALLVQRPEPGPGLDSDQIALLRSGNRFDFYAASRWAAAAPDLVESVIVDSLVAGGRFAGVYDDTSPYAPRYNLRCGLRRFEADYTITGAAGASGSAPTVFVTLDCTLGRHRDRELLATFRAQGSAAATEDRLNAVVAAFDRATAAAVAELQGAVTGAIERDAGRPTN